MPGNSRQRDVSRNSLGVGDIYFEPIGTIATPEMRRDSLVKQDVLDEDEFTPGGIEDVHLKSMIGAYGGLQRGLPAEKGFPIQIGAELFRLSGASIMSDAPSYFSRFFEEQVQSLAGVDGSIKTLYIDRDPDTFKDIAKHLQGYDVCPRDNQHYVRLFADAQFYSLPRLSKQLIGLELNVQIGSQQFKIPMSVFSSPGDSPNFFTLAFGMFMNSKEELYPGLDREGLIRPPPMEAPKVPGRSAKIFEDLLHLLRGYPLTIRDAEHRSALLKDCRYYNLKGLEQRVVFHDLSFDPQRQSYDRLMRIEDLRQTGLSVQQEDITMSFEYPNMCVSYARPYTDDEPHELVVEIADSSTILDMSSMKATFFNQTKARVTSLLQVVKNKLMSRDGNSVLHLPNADSVPFTISSEAHIVLDGVELPEDSVPQTGVDSASGNTDADTLATTSKKRKLSHTDKAISEKWTVAKGQWRILISNAAASDNEPWTVNVSLDAVKLDALSGPRARNQARRFFAG